MSLAETTLSDIVRLRREFHRHPERSGCEEQTARRIESFFKRLSPDDLLIGLGGFGIAAVFDSGTKGPSVLLRAELDAVPIQEAGVRSHRSTVPSMSHACGHDGHMAILCALAAWLARCRPVKGRVVILFQPAEETGAGAASVMGDPRFAAIAPDHVFALHNMPGFPEGVVVIRAGPFCPASIGIIFRFQGRTAHAAQPETGRSPALPMCRLVDGLPRLGRNPDVPTSLPLVTVVHARLGEPEAFGMAPGSAEVMATLRSETNRGLSNLVDRGIGMAESAAAAAGVTLEIDRRSPFPATVNRERETGVVAAAADSVGLPIHRLAHPLPWSEDFGRFTARFGGALFGLGAGRAMPDLHHPDYDFPDSLIPKGCALFQSILGQLLV